jgi:long-subunit fatty acid transport protein
MSANADASKDIEVDAKQTGSGLAPIFGLYLSPMEGLDIGLRYEGKATMTLTNETVVDGSGLFPDGAESHADMPAMIGVGVAYKAMPSLRIVADFNYYFNEDVNWDGREEFLENGMEYGAGLDFAVSDALRLSAGLLVGSGGALKGYATDLSHTFDTYTIGAGGRYYVNPNLYISFGVADTFYDEISNDGVNYGSITGNETYNKTSLDFALGIGFSR